MVGGVGEVGVVCVCVGGRVGVGDQLSHPDAANLLHASHVNGNATVCLEHHLFCTSQGDKPAETEFRPSVNL